MKRIHNIVRQALFTSLVFTVSLAFIPLHVSATEQPSVASADITDDPEYYKFMGLQESTEEETEAESEITIFDTSSRVTGIDVSSHNGEIDWDDVAHDGIKFAIIRAAYRGYGSSGTIVTDTRFEYNLREARKEEGLDVGLYFFSQATTPAEAEEEAKYLLNLAGNADLSLPLVIDFEYASSANGGHTGRLYDADLSKDEATAICNRFCKTIENAGRTAMVYANKSMLNNSLNASKIADNYLIWLAEWRTTVSYSGTFDYWQRGSKYVDGIDSKTDYNYRYISSPAKPASFKTTSVSTSKVSLSWSKVRGVHGYRVYRYNNTTTKWERLATVQGASKTSYTDSTVSPGTIYQYRVTPYIMVKNDQSYGTPSDTLTVSTPLTAPTNFKVSSYTTNSISLSWTGFTNCSGYVIYKGTSKSNINQSKPIVTITDPAQTTYTDSDLDIGTDYYYQIRAYKTSGSTIMYSPYSAILTGLTAPATPSAATFTARTDTTISLAWEQVPSASGYYVYRKLSTEADSKYKKIATINKNTTLTYKNTGLKAGTSYDFYLSSYKTAGGKTSISSASTSSTTVTNPAKISGAKTISRTDTSITLGWNKLAASDGYYIYVLNSDGTNYTQIGTVDSNASLQFTHEGLTPGTEYTYQIAAYKKDATSAFEGSTVTYKTMTCPSQATNVTAAPINNSSMLITWDQVAGATGYEVYNRLASNTTGAFKKVGTISKGNILSFTSKSLKTATSYEYRVRAVKKTNNMTAYGNYSETYSMTTAALAPATFKTTARTMDSISLSWKAVANAEGYEISRSTSAKGTYDVVVNITDGSILSYTDTSLVPGTTYYYRIRSTKSMNNVTACSTYRLHTSLTVPSKPQQVTATPVNAAYAVQLSWDEVNGATGYEIYRKPANDETVDFKKVSTVSKGTTITFKNTGLKAANTYEYQIRALKKLGNVTALSEYSDITTMTTAPALPSSFTTTNRTTDSITLNWKAVANAEGYEISRSTSAKGDYNVIQTVSADTLSYTDTTLANGTTYYYKLRSLCTERNLNAYSNYRQQTSGTLPAAVNHLTGYGKTAASIVLTWDEVAGATGYQIYRSDTIDGTYKKVATISKGTILTYTNNGLKTSRTYFYQICATKKIGNQTVSGSLSPAFEMITGPAKVTKLAAVKGDTSITLTWKLLDDADGYELERYDTTTRKYIPISTITASTQEACTYTDQALTPLTTYQYRIRAFHNTTSILSYGAYSSTLKVKTLQSVDAMSILETQEAITEEETTEEETTETETSTEEESTTEEETENESESPAEEETSSEEETSTEEENSTENESAREETSEDESTEDESSVEEESSELEEESLEEESELTTAE